MEHVPLVARCMKSCPKETLRKLTMLDSCSMNKTTENLDATPEYTERYDCTTQNDAVMIVLIVGFILPLSAMGEVGLLRTESLESGNLATWARVPPHPMIRSLFSRNKLGAREG